MLERPKTSLAISDASAPLVDDVEVMSSSNLSEFLDEDDEVEIEVVVAEEAEAEKKIDGKSEAEGVKAISEAIASELPTKRRLLDAEGNPATADEDSPTELFDNLPVRKVLTAPPRKTLSAAPRLELEASPAAKAPVVEAPPVEPPPVVAKAPVVAETPAVVAPSLVLEPSPSPSVVVEVSEPIVDRTAKFARVDLAKAAEVERAADAAEEHGSRTQRLSRAEFEAARAEQESRKLASIAPLSMDVPAAGTVKLSSLSPEYARAVTNRSDAPGTSKPLIGALVALVAAVGVGLFISVTRYMSNDEVVATHTANPRVAEDGVRQAVFDMPPMAPGKVETAELASAFAVAEPTPPPRTVVTAPAAEPRPSAAAPAPKAAPPKAASPAKAATPAPKASASASTAPPVAEAPPPPPPRPVATTGTVRASDESLRAIQVDGAYRRLSGGAVVVPCGRHKVQAGLAPAGVVNVPCGGAVTVP